MKTIKDVAREAGVSLGTVSNVLNGKESVKEANVKKVLQAIKKLDYNQNLIARTLRTKVSESIGLILPSITNPYYPEFVRGVEDYARKEDVTVLICNSDREKAREIAYINSLTKKAVDGFIIMNPQLSASELLELNHIKLVCIGIDDTPSPLNIVGSSATIGTTQGMELLYENGHRRIGFLTGGRDTYADTAKVQAYCDFLTAHDLTECEDLIYEGDYTWDSGYLGALELLKKEERPTAIFAANDLMAFGAIKAVKEQHLSIPKDISILGFDDIEMAKYQDPPLTTIHQPKYEHGVEAVKMLEAILLQDDKVEGLRQILPTRVVVRESVGKAPG